MKKHIIILYLLCSTILRSEIKFDLNKLNSFKRSQKNLTKNLNHDLSPDKILEELQNEDIEFVMFTFVDLLGNLKETILPISKAKNAFNCGLTFDSSSVLGYESTENSDMIIKPDLNTLRILPWTSDIYKTAWFMCDIYKETNIPYESDPRYILKKVLKELDQLNYVFNTGIELEFLLFAKKDPSIPIDNKGYFDAQIDYTRQQEDRTLIHALNSVGVDVEKFHHEVSPGQYEISINYSNALNIADQIITMKYVIQVIANQLGYIASFMPKPLHNQNGSAMHIHYSLSSIINKRNAFYSSENQYQLSNVAKSFLAGNIKYIKDFTAILNPTVNSYKRLVKHFEAPVYNCWGIKNRSALFRVPLLNQAPEEATRIEIRSPDPSTNPYLAFAVLLKTGLEGIKENLELTPPITNNIFNLHKDEVRALNIEILPKNLSQALDLLKNSRLAKDLLTDTGLQAYLKTKKSEVSKFNNNITNFELNQNLF